MKKIINFVKKHGLVISLLFVMISVLTGGAGYCLAEGAAVGDPDPNSPDPVDPDVNNLKSPDGNGAGQDLPGTQASATQLRRAKLVEDQYDPDIVEFEADDYVLLNHAQTIAMQRNVGGHDYEITDFRIGEEDLSLNVIDDIPAGEKIVLTEENCSGNLSLLGVSSTIVVKGVGGYENGSQTKKDGGLLVLFVVSNDEEKITCRPINGITKTEGVKSEYLREYTSPAIPAGTEMIITSVAASESQMIVQPDNSQPRPNTVYLQKMEFNILITDHEREVIKKTSWGLTDIKAQALRNFKKKQEYSLWIMAQSKFIMRTKDGNEEFVYTMQGALRQLTNTLGLDSKFKWEHISAIGKVMGTGLGKSKEAYAYCGMNKIAELENMPEILHHTVEYKHHKTDYGIVVRDLVSSFGTWHIVHAPALDDLGYKNFMVVIPMQKAKYYHNINGNSKTYEIDLKKAGNDSREASRFIYIESGALKLGGHTSLLVGPSDEIVEKNMSDNSNPINIVDAIPANPTDGMVISFDGLLSEDGPVAKVNALPADPADGIIIAPTVDIVVGTEPDTTTYKQDKYYIYSDNVWSEYEGVVLDGDKVWQYDADQDEWVQYTGSED